MVGQKTENLKELFYNYLEREDYDALSGFHKGKGLVARTLISMTYDKEDVRSWRAMEAIGRLAAEMEPEKVRTLVQRVLWMMREESGNNAWTGAEILGEIVAGNPGPNADIAPIVVSFHDEIFLRAGCMRALERIASVRPDLMEVFADVPGEYLEDPDPQVRGHAVAALRALGAGKHRDELERASADKGSFLYYREGRLEEVVIGEFAREAIGTA